MADLAAADEDEAVRRAAEYLERRQADVKIRDVLASAEFCGPYWDEFVEGLIRYGYAVIGAWVRTGLIFCRCSSAGIGIGEKRFEWSREDQEDLIQDAIIYGLKMFRRALKEGRWTAHGGASLKTYFIGACCRAFANAYRRWSAQQENEAALVWKGEPADTLSTRADPRADVETAALTGLAVSGELAKLDTRTRAVILLAACGYSQEEIAETTGTTPRAVEGILYRHRRRRDGRMLLPRGGAVPRQGTGCHD